MSTPRVGNMDDKALDLPHDIETRLSIVKPHVDVLGPVWICEDRSRFVKAHAMLRLVRGGLLIVPFKFIRLK